MNRSITGRKHGGRQRGLRRAGPAQRVGGDMQPQLQLRQQQQQLSGTGAQISAADRGGQTARCVLKVDAGCEGGLDTLGGNSGKKKEGLFKTNNPGCRVTRCKWRISQQARHLHDQRPQVHHQLIRHLWKIKTLWLREEEAGSHRSESSPISMCVRCDARPLYLGPVSLGVFVDFRQGQVGVELISVFLRDRKHACVLKNKRKKQMRDDKKKNKAEMFDFVDSLATPRPGGRSSPAR